MGFTGYGHTQSQTTTTKRGSTLTQPVVKYRTVKMSIPENFYTILEVIQTDVNAYLSHLVESHCRGLIKSAQINAERKQTRNGNVHKG